MTDTKDAAGGQVTLAVEEGDEAAVVALSPALLRRGQRGMVSAEWAVGIIAAVAIAGVLLSVVTSGPVERALLDYILDLISKFARAGR